MNNQNNYLLLIRNDNYGHIYYDTTLICYTIDPHVLTTGTYNIQVNYSHKFKKELPLIYNNEFSAQRGFRIHAGNTLKDSQGCILVGDAIDYKFKLRDSKKALNRLLQVIKENEIKELVII